MKSLISSRMAVMVLASLAVITLSSCNKKNDESVSNNPETTPSTSSTATSPSGTTAASPSKSASSGSTAGVAPQGTTCPSGNPVKGVTSQKLGGKVALTTKSPVYNSTKPEKCFPDTASAQTAGYKVPK